jgi:hypothetical protein
MKRISSRSTFFNKKVFPAVWFGFLDCFILLAIRAPQKDSMILVVPILMGVFGFFLMKKLVWNLVDEVYDCGDHLLVRNRGDEDEVALSNIMNVSASVFVNPPRITLRLVNAGKFGNEIAFSPPSRFVLNPFAKDPVSEDLIIRVDQARSKRSTA